MAIWTFETGSCGKLHYMVLYEFAQDDGQWIAMSSHQLYLAILLISMGNSCLQRESKK